MNDAMAWSKGYTHPFGTTSRTLFALGSLCVDSLLLVLFKIVFKVDINGVDYLPA